MKRIVISIILVVIMSFCTLSAYCYSVTDHAMSDDISTVINSGGMYLVSFYGNDVHAERVAPDGAYADMKLKYNAASAALCGDKLVALCNDFDNDQLLVCTYDIYDDIQVNFAVNGVKADNDTRFYYDGDTLWLPDRSSPSVIERYSRSGAMLSSYDFGGNNAKIMSGYDNVCYIICGGKLYRADANGYVIISGAVIGANARMIGTNALMDSSGRIYRINVDSAALTATVDSDGLCSAALADNGDLYYSSGDTVYRYNVDSARAAAYIRVGGYVSALYYYGGELYAVCGHAVDRISPSELTDIPDSEDDRGNNAFSGISSDVYRVDSSSYRISRISSPTTFAQFKQNMSYDGYKAALYRGDKKLDSGKVGTAMTVTFSGSDTYTYELSVIGDLTGEGNANSRDVDELADYFLGNIYFDGVYTQAADINDDGSVDIIDFAMLCRTAG